MCNFSQTFVTLFQPSALDGNRSAWLVLELTSWIIVGSQLHSNTWFTHSVWLDVEEPETVICVPCCSCFLSFLLMLENTSTSLALQEILSSLSHHPTRKRGGQKNPNPVVPLSVCAVGAVCVVSNFRCCKPLCVTPLCLFGLDYISLAVNTFLFSPLKCKSVFKAEKDSIVKWFLW